MVGEGAKKGEDPSIMVTPFPSIDFRLIYASSPRAVQVQIMISEPFRLTLGCIETGEGLSFRRACTSTRYTEECVGFPRERGGVQLPDHLTSSPVYAQQVLCAPPRRKSSGWGWKVEQLFFPEKKKEGGNQGSNP